MSERRYMTGVPPDQLRGSNLGLEKEGLRVSQEGRISQQRHPLGLGSALTHPSITTDFSEALLEVITPPCQQANGALANLGDTQAFIHRHLGDELIWPASMPCRLDKDTEIPIACYGCSSNGMAKHVYRRGLAHRYGRMMQTISGVHFNFSFAETLWPTLQQIDRRGEALHTYVAGRYMSTLRNIQRYDWLLLYLFGASPAAHIDFTGAREKLQRFDQETAYAPFATSLRMSDMGYSNRLPTGHSVFIDNSSLSSYIDTLRQAVDKPHPPYQAISTQVAGERRQLNTHLLQIENEHYTSVRPKQAQHADESPLTALERRGIRYLELRSLDVNPFDPLGATLEQLRFLEIFLHFCLFHETPAYDRQQAQRNQYNLNRTAYEGRHPKLKLNRDGTWIGLRPWAGELFDAMQPVAQLLDSTHGGYEYTSALEQQRLCLMSPDLTPSARLLTTLRDQRESFIEFALRQSTSHHQYYMTRDLLNARRDYFEALSRQSLRQQRLLEQKELALLNRGDQTLEASLCTRSGPQRCACCCD
jgi:glutamate--cysteine ligase